MPGAVRVSLESVGLIGRYRVERMIGEGVAGTVYRAHDTVLDRQVALKLARTDRLDAEKLRLVVAEFRHEAEVAGKFAHDNIVTIYDCVSAPEGHYLVMEYMPGRSLDEYLRSTGPLRVKEALAIAYKCCVALAFVHYHGIIHRDIKPGNIMYHPPQRLVKLTDFSLASRIEEQPLRDNGTVAYMAPEHFDPSRRISQLTDIFALGSTLYRLLTGHYPFSPNHTAFHILHDDPEPIQTHRPDVPDELCHLITTAMAKQDADRHQSAAEFARAVKIVARTLYPGLRIIDSTPRYLAVR